MPVNITDVDTFTDPVQAPADADAADGTTFQLAPQGLANRTRNLKNRVDVLDGRSSSTLYRDIPIALAGTNTSTIDNTNNTIYDSSDGIQCWVPLILPDGYEDSFTLDDVTLILSTSTSTGTLISVTFDSNPKAADTFSTWPSPDFDTSEWSITDDPLTSITAGETFTYSLKDDGSMSSIAITESSKLYRLGVFFGGSGDGGFAIHSIVGTYTRS